jgi:hypothetical protein
VATSCPCGLSCAFYILNHMAVYPITGRMNSQYVVYELVQSTCCFQNKQTARCGQIQAKETKQEVQRGSLGLSKVTDMAVSECTESQRRCKTCCQLLAFMSRDGSFDARQRADWQLSCHEAPAILFN